MARVMIFDLECNGLDLREIDRIHVIAVYDSSDGKYHRFDNAPGKVPISRGVELLQQADVLVGHNIIDFDIPVIQKFFPEFRPKKVVDTLVFARLVFADIKEIDFKLHHKGRIPAKLIGSHSLEAYGYRLGVHKDDFHEKAAWQEWSEEMSDYCEQDVRVTKALYEKLLSKNFSQESIELEHQVAWIIKRQTDRGFYFDVEKAEELYARLLARQEELTKQLREAFPPWYGPDGKPHVPKRDNKKLGVRAGCEYQRIKLVEFNPASRQHIARVLTKKYGWKPVEYTAAGQPKVDEEVLSRLPYPEAKLLSEYLMIQKRLGQLGDGNQAWLKLVDPDRRIRGRVITNGAVTGRMTHHSPNLAQVPAVNIPYGKEMRALFGPGPGYVQVGCDASGLELRCLAHYMARWDHGEYARIVVEGDIHTANQEAAGLPTREMAKTFIYGFLYGAGDEKIGAIIGRGREAGRKLRETFLKRIPAIAKLREAIDRVVKTRGYLIGLDGRRLKVRSAHSALNTLLQSAGAIIMKKALVILDERLQQSYIPGVDYEFMANIHDEWQIECKPEIAEEVGKAAVQAIRDAGKYFNFRCPLDGEYRIGRNWAETH